MTKEEWDVLTPEEWRVLRRDHLFKSMWAGLNSSQSYIRESAGYYYNQALAKIDEVYCQELAGG